jgi:Flp pilus assembly pilin Flp
VKNLIPLFTRFLVSQSGSTAVEYGLIAGGIVLAMLAPIALMTEEANSMYAQIMGYFESTN